MYETAFIRLHQAVTGIEILLYGTCMAAFLRPFMDESPGGRRSIRQRCLLVSFLYAAVFIPGMLLPGSGGLYMILLMALLTGCGRFLGVERKLLFLLSTLFFCMRNLSLMVIRSVDYFTGRLLLENADTPQKVYESASGNVILTDALMFLLFALMLHGLVRQLRKQPLILHTRELCYLLLPPVTGIVFVNLTIRLLVIVNGDSVFQLYESVSAAVYVIPLLAALFYAGTLAAAAVCQRVVALQEERSGYFAKQQQLAAMQDRLAQAEQLCDDVRRMKHEMRGHLSNIRGLAGSGLYEELERYIAKMDAGFRALSPHVSTGNAVTDIIISDTQRAAARLAIDFRADFVYPSAGGYDAYDMGIILNNLLQNALEACEKEKSGQRHISVSGRKKRRFFLIEVRNSFEGEIRFDRRSGLPISTKESVPCPGSLPLHGMGLSNVRREAEKYHGNVDITTAGKEFLVTVLLQEKSAD